jgi:hypothetical protein
VGESGGGRREEAEEGGQLREGRIGLTREDCVV